MFRIKVVRKIETHFVVPVVSHMEKYCAAGQATDDNMAHSHCMLDNWGYKHALRICNTYCFSTPTVVTRTH